MNNMLMGLVSAVNIGLLNRICVSLLSALTPEVFV